MTTASTSAPPTVPLTEATPTYRFVQVVDSAGLYGLYQPDGSEIDLALRGPSHLGSVDETPEITEGTFRHGCFYHAVAYLPPGLYYHTFHTTVDQGFLVIDVDENGCGLVSDHSFHRGFSTFMDLLDCFEGIPLWIQGDLLDGWCASDEYRKLLVENGYPDIGEPAIYRVMRTANDVVWVYLVDGELVYANLLEGIVWKDAWVPRRLKKALCKIAWKRCRGERRRVDAFLRKQPPPPFLTFAVGGTVRWNPERSDIAALDLRDRHGSGPFRVVRVQSVPPCDCRRSYIWIEGGRWHGADCSRKATAHPQWLVIEPLDGTAPQPSEVSDGPSTFSGAWFTHA